MKISIIGGGPRGLSVAEAICKKLVHCEEQTIITLYDNYAPGAGRIWRPEQSSNLLMNTLARQVTMFSDGDDLSKGLGYGPTLKSWLEKRDGKVLDDNYYAPRKDYGEYLLYVISRLTENCPSPHKLITKKVFVNDIIPDGNRYKIICSDGRTDYCDKVVLCTGHTKSNKSFLPFDKDDVTSKVSIIEGDSCEDQNISQIGAGEPVGVLGMGLGFLDLLSSFTEKRGGRFENIDGKLVYHKSLKEPKIYAGSRSGLPIPARAINQKFNYKQTFMFFDDKRVDMLLKDHRPKDFYKEIWPYIFAEMEHVYYSTFLQNTDGENTAKEFQKAHLKYRDALKPIPDELVKSFALHRIEPLDPEKLKDPFKDQHYDSLRSFNDNCIKYLSSDLSRALSGNLKDPRKAALDTLRDIRDNIRTVVEFDGLTEDSLEQFIHKFSSISSHLAAGPPIHRIQQVIALVNAGVLTIMGPDVTFDVNPETQLISFGSKNVDNGFVDVKYLIDGRTPFPCLKHSDNILLKNLLKNGIITQYVHSDKKHIINGGIAVDRNSYSVIDANNSVNKDIFALGIPIEKPKWFTQVGSATPGKISQFTKEANIVANNILEPLSMRAADVA